MRTIFWDELFSMCSWRGQSMTCYTPHEIQSDDGCGCSVSQLPGAFEAERLAVLIQRVLICLTTKRNPLYLRRDDRLLSVQCTRRSSESCRRLSQAWPPDMWYSLFNNLGATRPYTGVRFLVSPILSSCVCLNHSNLRLRH